VLIILNPNGSIFKNKDKWGEMVAHGQKRTTLLKGEKTVKNLTLLSIQASRYHNFKNINSSPNWEVLSIFC
jgi:hypothetical protein